MAFWDFLSDLGGGLDDWLGAAGKAAQLGTAGLGIYGGIKAMEKGGQQQKLLEQAQKSAQAERERQWARSEEQWGEGAPLRKAGSQLTQAGAAALQGGALPEGLEAKVRQWGNDTRMKLRDYFTRAGIGDSSMMAQYEGWIVTQEQQMRAQLASELMKGGAGTFQAGMAGAQGAAVPESVIPSAQQQTGDIGSIAEQANRALALLQGRSSGTKKKEEEERKRRAPSGQEEWL